MPLDLALDPLLLAGGKALQQEDPLSGRWYHHLWTGASHLHAKEPVFYSQPCGASLLHRSTTRACRPLYLVSSSDQFQREMPPNPPPLGKWGAVPPRDVDHKKPTAF